MQTVHNCKQIAFGNFFGMSPNCLKEIYKWCSVSFFLPIPILAVSVQALYLNRLYASITAVMWIRIRIQRYKIPDKIKGKAEFNQQKKNSQEIIFFKQGCGSGMIYSGSGSGSEFIFFYIPDPDPTRVFKLIKIT